jgi:hypothetical protein
MAPACSDMTISLATATAVGKHSRSLLFLLISSHKDFKLSATCHKLNLSCEVPRPSILLIFTFRNVVPQLILQLRNRLLHEQRVGQLVSNKVDVKVVERGITFDFLQSWRMGLPTAVTLKLTHLPVCLPRKACSCQ